jgi:stage II sporulation protein D
MINDVPLESYLRGVIAHEVSASWPAEALKAQACAARAFALGSRVPSRSWDVYCDVRSQAYVGVGMEDSRTDAAIRATAGVTPAYKGKAIQAFYFDCSGGHTENIEYGWPGASPVPYLKGVDDPYETSAPAHIWPGIVHKTAGQLRSPLASYVKGTLQAVYAVKLGTSPRIVKAAVIGSSGVAYIDGNELRMKLGLRSTWAAFVSMSISPAAGDHASVVLGSSVTLTGRTYPALAAGAGVSLHYYYDGRWRSRLVPTARGSQKLPSGYTAAYSSYSVPVSPAKTTRYYFSSGAAKSPETTVTVRAASPPTSAALGAGLPSG